MEFYEHILDSNVLPLNVPWRFVETPENTKLLYEEQNWHEGMSSELITQYRNEAFALQDRLGYKGVGRMELVKRARTIPKGMEKYYRAAYKLHLDNPEDKFDEKYAACVPHIQIYPAMKTLKVSSSKLIELT